MRAKVDHVFRVVKCQFGDRKVRYRGIEKNAAQLFALFALANIFLARSRLRPHEGKIGSSGLFQRRASGLSAAVPRKKRRRASMPRSDDPAFQRFLARWQRHALGWPAAKVTGVRARIDC